MLSGKGNRHQRQVQLEVQLHTIMIQVVTPNSLFIDEVGGMLHVQCLSSLSHAVVQQMP